MEASDQLQAPAALYPGKNPGTNSVGGWVGLRACLDVLEKKKKSFAPTGIRTTDCPTRSPVTTLTALYRLIINK